MNKKKLISSVVLSNVFLLFAYVSVLAQDVVIDPEAIGAGDKIGDVNTLNDIVRFIFNLLTYLGWAGVIIGVGLAIFSLIYKLLQEDNEKVMQTVQGYVTKAVIIVVAGILLISAGFIIRTVAQLFNLSGFGVGTFESIGQEGGQTG